MRTCKSNLHGGGQAKSCTRNSVSLDEDTADTHHHKVKVFSGKSLTSDELDFSPQAAPLGM